MSPPLPPAPPPPFGIGGILAQNNLKGKQPRIPWYEGQEDYRVIIYTARNDIGGPTDAEQDPEILKAVIDSYLHHYFPEFYPYTLSEYSALDEDHLASYTALKTAITNSLRVVNFKNVTMGDFGQPFTKNNRITFSAAMDLAVEREGLDLLGKLPDFETALQEFNANMGFGPEDSFATFEVTTFPSLAEEMGGAMTSFGDFNRQLSQAAQAGMPNFSVLEREIRQLVAQLMDIVYDSIDATQGTRPTFAAQDYVTVYFDNMQAQLSDGPHILRIEYFLLNVTEGNTEPSKIGYFTNIQYNLLLTNPVNIYTLKNYKSLIDEAGQLLGLLDLGDLENPGIMGVFENLSAANGQSIFSDEVFEQPLDVNDFEELAKTIDSFISYEEVAKIDKAANDPAIRRRMIAKEKAKKLNAAIKVTKIIDKFADFNFPLAGPNKSKEAKVINQILTQFGIQQLVREALICLTFGVGAAIQRITAAVRNSLMSTDLYTSPRRPSDELNLERPALGDFKVYFSITGDPPLGKQILNMLLTALAKAGFELISALAELIKLNCHDILRGPQNQGLIDLGEELEELNNNAAMDIPNLSTDLAAIYGLHGFKSPPEAYAYFSDVSQILDVIELCRLLNSPEEVEDFTLTKIIAFNQTYHIESVRENLITGNRIISFFQQSSQNVDTVTMCNEYINNTVQEAVAGCNVCLDSGFWDGLEKSAAVEELVHLLEYGPEVVIPELDFGCPESSNFIDNPVLTRTIPMMFDTLIGSIGMYLGGSIESAKSALLINTVTSDRGPGGQAVDDADNPMYSENDDAEVDTKALDIIMEIFEKLSEGLQFISDNANSDICEDLNLNNLPALSEIDAVIAALAAGMAEVGPAIQDVANNISAVQDSLQDGSTSASSAGMPAVIPEFNMLYKRAVSRAASYLAFEDSSYGDYQASSGRPYYGDAQYGRFEGSTISSYGRWYLPTQQFNSVTMRGEYQLQDSIGISSHVPTFATTFASGLNFQIVYPAFSEISDGAIELTWDIPLGEYFPANRVQSLAGSLSHNSMSPLPTDESYKDYDLNPYVFRFMESMPATPGSVAWTELATEDFASAQSTLYRKVYEYILRNGAFSVASLNNLNLFKNNTNCAPADAGDLLDADGIIDQMKKALGLLLCSSNSGVNLGPQIKKIIQFGIINLLIQAVFVEFIIKNITVFAAFKPGDIFGDNSFLRQHAIDHISYRMWRYASGPGARDGFTSDERGLLHKAIREFFDDVAPLIYDTAGEGYRHTSMPPASSPDAAFSAPDYYGLNDINHMIRFMVEERIGYTWTDTVSLAVASANSLETAGDPVDVALFQRSTISSIANILDSGQKSYSDAYLTDIIGVYGSYLHMLDGVGFESFKVGQSYDTSMENTSDMAYSSTYDSYFNPETRGSFAIVKEVVLKNAADVGGTWLSGVGDFITLSAEYFTAHYDVAVGDVGAHYADITYSGLADNAPADFEFLQGRYTLYYFPAATNSEASLRGWIYPSHGSSAVGATEIAAEDYELVVGQVIAHEVHPSSGVTKPPNAPIAVMSSVAYEGTNLIVPQYSELPSEMLSFLGGSPGTAASIAAGIPAEDTFGRVNPIEGYGPGLVRLNALRHTQVSPSNINNLKASTIMSYLDQVASPTMGLTVPLMHNLYLTERFFPAGSHAFNTTFRAIINLLQSVEDTSSPPEFKRPPGFQINNNNMAAPDGNSLENLARDIFLKFIRETPLYILKGLCELIDPHVAISKLIRDITAMGFSTASKAITTVIDGLDDDNPLKVAGSGGDDVLGLAFCGYNLANTFGSEAAAGGLSTGESSADAPLFGPNITLDGVDFTGTVSGIFIAPPSPLGIAYIIIKWLLDQIEIPDGSEEEQVVDANMDDSDADEC